MSYDHVTMKEVRALGWNSIQEGRPADAIHAQQLYLIGALLVEIRDLLERVETRTA